MKYFIDTEFIEKVGSIDLLSIGIVSQDNRELYFESNEFDIDNADDFVKKNVLPQLKGDGVSNKEIRQGILNFIGNDTPEFWGYYSSYDWVAFCWIFGKMVELPKSFPDYCSDIKQLSDFIGNPKLPEQKTQIHNSLEDAKWIKKSYFFLRNKIDALII